MSALLDFSLRANENKARLFEEMPTAYCIVGENGELLWENKAFHKILQRDEKIERNIFNIFPEYAKGNVKGEGSSTGVTLLLYGKKILYRPDSSGSFGG